MNCPLPDAPWSCGKITSEAQLLLGLDYLFPLSDSLQTPLYHSASWLEAQLKTLVPLFADAFIDSVLLLCPKRQVDITSLAATEKPRYRETRKHSHPRFKSRHKSRHF